MKPSADEIAQALRILYTWIARNVPQVIPEPGMPPMYTTVQRLLTSTAKDWKEISRWHMVKSDEIWMYHAGSPAIQLLLLPDGTFEERIVGPDVLGGEFPQSLIPAWTWQSTVLLDRSEQSWGLFGAVVCPGFEYQDYEEGSAEELLKKYPEAKDRILELGLA